MADKFAGKDLLKQQEVKAILDYYELIATYRLTKMVRGDGVKVYELLEGPEKYFKVLSNFDSNILDYNKTNVELLIQLENNLSGLSVHTSLSPSVKAKFSTLDWIDFSIDCLNMDDTAKNTLDKYSDRIEELYESSNQFEEYQYEQADVNELIKSIVKTSEKFK